MIHRLVNAFTLLAFAVPALTAPSAIAQSATAWPEAEKIFHSDPIWLGGDGAYSIDLGGGRVLWLFGDSFVAGAPGQGRKDARMVRNSVAVEQGYDPSKAGMKFYWRTQKNQAQSFIPEKEDRWYWPLHGARLGKKVLLFCNLIGNDTTPGGLGFKSLAPAAFVFDNADSEPDKWHCKEIALPQNDWNIFPGVAVIRENEWLYAFAFDEPKHSIFLSRLAAARAEKGDLSDFQWWCGPKDKWRGQKSMVAPPVALFENGATELSVHFDVARKKYIAVQSYGFGGTTVCTREADSLTGPWGGLTEVYTPPESKDKEPMVYAAKAHPELSGGFVMTYATNGNLQRLVDDMGIYFPRVVRILP